MRKKGDSAGTQAVLAYRWTADTSNFAEPFTLSLRSYYADPAVPSSSNLRLDAGAESFGIAPCGPGCMATAYLPKGAAQHLSTVFTTDVAPLLVQPRGPDAGTWDVACGSSLQQPNVAVTWHEGRLRYLVGEITRVSLYSCDLPPP